MHPSLQQHASGLACRGRFHVAVSSRALIPECSNIIAAGDGIKLLRNYGAPWGGSITLYGHKRRCVPASMKTDLAFSMNGQVSDATA